MKLALSAALLAGVASASAHSVIRGDAARALMKKSTLRRKLEDEENDAEEEEEEEEYAWMQDYKVKFVGCVAGEKFQNQENGEYEGSSVIYRLCASDGECDDESNFGCEEAYGDYVVGINTYTEAFAETLREDDRRRKLSSARRLEEEEFDLNEFAQCGRIEVEDDEDENDNEDEDEEEVEYFVGPACSDDGKDIILSMYSDEDCLYDSDVDFYELAGQNLPYYDGGIASSYCQSCVGEVNDDGEYETSEFCMKMQEASAGCDEYDQSMCETIDELTADLRAEEKKGGGWKVFWIIVAILLLGGVGWYLYKKQLARKAAAGVDTTPIGGGAMS